MAWADVQARHLKAMLPYRSSCLACFRLYGLIPAHHPSFLDIPNWFEKSDGDAADGGLSAAAGAAAVNSEGAAAFRQELFVDDGACRKNQYARFRSAGYGASWATGHFRNLSLPLEGWVQTNNRSELKAVVAVLETELRVEIRSDSDYVRNGFLNSLAV